MHRFGRYFRMPPLPGGHGRPLSFFALFRSFKEHLT